VGKKLKFFNIGKRVHIAQGCILVDGDVLILEDYVGLSPGVKIFTNSESPRDGNTMSGPIIPERYEAFIRVPVVVRKDAFLSTNAVVLPGVTIGEGAVVGANAVEKKGILSYCIAAGAPTQVIGKRDKVVIPDI